MKQTLTILLASVCWRTYVCGRKSFDTSHDNPPSVQYAGPIVYTDEKPPTLHFPPPPMPMAYEYGSSSKGKQKHQSIKYVPLPHHDLPVLIYTSDSKPPVHVVHPTHSYDSKPKPYSKGVKGKGKQKGSKGSHGGSQPNYGSSYGEYRTDFLAQNSFDSVEQLGQEPREMTQGYGPANNSPDSGYGPFGLSSINYNSPPKDIHYESSSRSSNSNYGSDATSANSQDVANTKDAVYFRSPPVPSPVYIAAPHPQYVDSKYISERSGDEETDEQFQNKKTVQLAQPFYPPNYGPPPPDREHYELPASVDNSHISTATDSENSKGAAKNSSQSAPNRTTSIKKSEPPKNPNRTHRPHPSYGPQSMLPEAGGVKIKDKKFVIDQTAQDSNEQQLNAHPGRKHLAKFPKPSYGPLSEVLEQRIASTRYAQHSANKVPPKFPKPSYGQLSKLVEHSYGPPPAESHQSNNLQTEPSNIEYSWPISVQPEPRYEQSSQPLHLNLKTSHEQFNTISEPIRIVPDSSSVNITNASQQNAQSRSDVTSPNSKHLELRYGELNDYAHHSRSYDQAATYGPAQPYYPKVTSAPHILYAGHPPIHVYQQPTVYEASKAAYYPEEYYKPRRVLKGSKPKGKGGLSGLFQKGKGSGGYDSDDSHSSHSEQNYKQSKMSAANIDRVITTNYNPQHQSSQLNYHSPVSSNVPHKSIYGHNSPTEHNRKNSYGSNYNNQPEPVFLPAPKSYHKPPIIIYQGIRPPVHVYKQPLVGNTYSRSGSTLSQNYATQNEELFGGTFGAPTSPEMYTIRQDTEPHNSFIAGLSMPSPSSKMSSNDNSNSASGRDHQYSRNSVVQIPSLNAPTSLNPFGQLPTISDSSRSTVGTSYSIGKGQSSVHTSGVSVPAPHLSFISGGSSVVGTSYVATSMEASAPIGSVVPVPVGSALEVPIRSAVSGPVGSSVQIPVGSALSKPFGSALRVPIGSSVQVPIGSSVQVPILSAVPRPAGSALQVPIRSAPPVPTSSADFVPTGTAIVSTIGLGTRPAPTGSNISAYISPTTKTTIKPSTSSQKPLVTSEPGTPKLHFIHPLESQLAKEYEAFNDAALSAISGELLKTKKGMNTTTVNLKSNEATKSVGKGNVTTETIDLSPKSKTANKLEEKNIKSQIAEAETTKTSLHNKKQDATKSQPAGPAKSPSKTKAEVDDETNVGKSKTVVSTSVSVSQSA